MTGKSYCGTVAQISARRFSRFCLCRSESSSCLLSLASVANPRMQTWHTIETPSPAATGALAEVTPEGAPVDVGGVLVPKDGAAPGLAMANEKGQASSHRARPLAPKPGWGSPPKLPPAASSANGARRLEVNPPSPSATTAEPMRLAACLEEAQQHLASSPSPLKEPLCHQPCSVASQRCPPRSVLGQLPPRTQAPQPPPRACPKGKPDSSREVATEVQRRHEVQVPG
eukprot:CAMPEP_0204520318 /NCGR_PEP_ID=MMETSP0661-20131031/5200_1 /ASSEMBLY_ACC=CAM_ASM_000606 /TAXON_ID=109239 /ORGANISM="Alexandrium margalefi, Strain AMGDE01CS-322" /LENGTH=227 /DNA_ID=CAMNT_0051525869 /DNA_START=104 /DNA_END=784 /DNA_ORIENTATION=+